MMMTNVGFHEDELVCCCGHSREEHETTSGSCQLNDGSQDGCLCAGFEGEE